MPTDPSSGSQAADSAAGPRTGAPRTKAGASPSHQSSPETPGALKTPRLPPNAPVTALKGVGEATAEMLRGHGLATLQDLAFCFPHRAEPVVDCAFPTTEVLGQRVRLRGVVRTARNRWLPGRRSMTTIRFAVDGEARTAEAPTPEESGSSADVDVAFFNQPWLARNVEVGSERSFEGVLDQHRERWKLVSPRILSIDEDGPAGPVSLVHADREGLSSKRIRSLVEQAFAHIDRNALQLPWLPPDVEHGFATPADAVHAMHAPETVEEHEDARRLFARAEAAELFMRVERARASRQTWRAHPCPTNAEVRARIFARLPFQLTADQAAAVDVLFEQLCGPAPCGVLLQGDVGTGKTAVALCAALAVIAHRQQVAFLAPTELLAEQHAEAIGRTLAATQVRCSVLTGSMKAKTRREAELAIANGEVDLVFGTHALFSSGTEFSSLGLVVIDEQHRFGVDQRAELVRKGRAPHVLVMTATPIPRTAAWAMFGDLDTLTLRTRPGGHQPPRAMHLPKGQWARVLRTIARHLVRDERVFVVCPLVGEEGEKGGAVALHESLRKAFRCGLVHGRLSGEERRATTQAFREGQLDVLIGTTVLEVGIDVPAATLMVVVKPERFGLATLHQLRGRVGRGAKRGVCLLVGEHNARVQAMCQTTDGFELAETDLWLRGSGELFGTKQSGTGELRAFNPMQDRDLLLGVRDAVRDSGIAFAGSSKPPTSSHRGSKP